MTKNRLIQQNIINFRCVSSGDAYGKNSGATKELMRKIKICLFIPCALTHIGLSHLSVCLSACVYLFCAHLIVRFYAVFHLCYTEYTYLDSIGF